MSSWSPEEFLAGVQEGQPLYWMHEQSGRMRQIVKKFLQNQELTPEELLIVRWYVFQWVDAMPRKPRDYDKILKMDQSTLKSYTYHVLVSEYAIDPF